MTHVTALRSALLVAITLLLPASAHAQLFRAYLASGGFDTNNCTLQAPCRLVPRALSVVANGGEIWMLDSANYNTSQVNIDKSVTILAVPGALGSMIALNGVDAINIVAGGISVTLRNLSITPAAGGVNGIVMSAGARLSVENLIIYNFTLGMGIRVTTAATVRIFDSVVRDNSSGIWLQGGATADISGVKIMGNSQIGVRVNGNVGGITASAAITDSLLTGNGFGISGNADNATGVARIAVNRSMITNNLHGVRGESLTGTVQVTVGNSSITGNDTALVQIGTGTTLESMGNNTIRQNTNANTGTISTAAPS